MANIRVTQTGVGTVGHVGGYRNNRSPGDPTGLQINTFGMDKLIGGLTGDQLVEIVTEAFQPAYFQLLSEWAVDTGASRDSARISVIEVGARMCRVALEIGGQQLIDDIRNEKHINYAPFLEFNGSPGGTPPGVLLNAVIDNYPEAVQYIHERVGWMIKRIIGA